MKRNTVDRLSWVRIQASLCTAVFICIHCGPAMADSIEQSASLDLTAQVSLRKIESVLRSRINAGKPIRGRKVETHASGKGAYGIAYKVNISALTVAANQGELVITVPIRLMPIRGRKSLIWFNSPVDVAFAPKGCGPTTVRVATRIKLTTADGKLTASTRAGRVTIDGSCRIKKRQSADIVIQPLRLNPTLRSQIDALLRWQVHHTIRDTVGAQVSSAIRQQLSQATLAQLVADFQQRAVARFSKPIPLPLESTELELHIGQQIELLQVAVEGKHLRIAIRAMVSPQIIFDGASNSAQSSRGSARGFRLPLDLVLPLTPIADGKVSQELIIDIPRTKQALAIARVRAQRDLIRVRMTSRQHTSSLMYFAARQTVGSDATFNRSFSELLNEASHWLADASRWPTAARRDTALLSRQVKEFQRKFVATLSELGSVSLQPGVSFSLTEPTIVLGDGHVNDNMIRIPAMLSGFASVTLSIE